MSKSADTARLLQATRVEVDPGIYSVVSLRHEDWTRILDNPELSPRGSVPYMLLRDRYEVTLVLDETDWRTMRHAARDAKVEGGFRLVTLDTELGWDVVGYLAFVTEILADAGIPIGAISAFSRDHLLIRQNDLARALKALGPHVLELC